MKKILFLLVAIAFSACEKEYQVQYSGPYDPNNTVIATFPFEFMYVADNQVFVTTVNFVKTKKISKEGEIIQRASINPSRTKIAYKESMKNIIITDIEGNYDTTILNTQDVVAFDWQLDNSVFYMMKSNGKVSFWNGSIPISTLDLNTLSYLTLGIKVFRDLVILSDNRILCTYKNSSTGNEYLHLENASSGSNNIVVGDFGMYSYNLKAEQYFDGSLSGTLGVYDGGYEYFDFTYSSSGHYSLYKKPEGLSVNKLAKNVSLTWEKTPIQKLILYRNGINTSYELDTIQDRVSVIDIN